MPLQATSGAASYDAFGGGVPVVPAYIEEVFQTWLYAGNGSSQTITNGIDLSTKGGLVWIKRRNGAISHALYDTARGVNDGWLTSNTTDAAYGGQIGLDAFLTNGFSLGDGGSRVNTSASTYASWTFRKQPKFFDVVTYTGTGTNRTVSHNLNSTPGCIITKKTNATGEWLVYHIGQDNYAYTTRLNSTAGQGTLYTAYSATPTSTQFSVDGDLNASGDTYVAYLFAHNAGGFGLTGTDNVISCGSFTTDGSGNATVSLGYEPQYILMKKTSGVQNWVCYDTMRGWAQAQQAQLYPNITQAEDMYTGSPYFFPTATGFSLSGTFGLGNNDTFIYIAIRRGPMKVPTSGTSVFSPVARTGTGAVAQVTGVGFSPDFSLTGVRSGSPYNGTLYDRLRGAGYRIGTRTTAAEGYDNDTLTSFNMNGVSLGADNFGYINTSGGIDYINWFFKRAPSFFDEVCYTGTGADPQTVPHNLGKAPELMIFKARAVGAGWRIWGGNMAITEYLALNEDSAVVTGPAFFGGTLPTATSFYVGSGLSVSARTHVAYLFATAAGVSKVFSYTGNGSSQTINCGFTAGARFVLIKRTDSTGDWYVWDTARGIVSGNDPHLSLNTTAAEVTTDDTIDTDSTGFVVNQVSATNVNVSSATYIGLAIA